MVAPGVSDGPATLPVQLAVTNVSSSAVRFIGLPFSNEEANRGLSISSVLQG